jgi:hypothetical protein
MEFRSDFQKLGAALQNSHPLFPPMCCATWTQNRLACTSSVELLYSLSPSEGISKVAMRALEYWHHLRLFQPKANAPLLQYWCECSLVESLLRCFLIWSDLAKGPKQFCMVAQPRFSVGRTNTCMERVRLSRPSYQWSYLFPSFV